MLGHGRALAFPYGFVPWLTAAIFRPLAGDWIVTLWLVLGFVGIVVTTYLAFPELRRGWWAVVVLVNPALFSAPLSGQLPFMWGASMLLGAIACWRAGNRRWAIVLAALAQITHPAILVPITLGLFLGRLRWDDDRRRLVKAYVLATLPAVPFALLVLVSPVFVESSLATKIGELAITLGPRSLIVAVPVAAAMLTRPRVPDLVAVAACVVLVGATGLTWKAQDMKWTTAQLSRYPDSVMVDFTRSAEFEPGRTYRVLRSRDGKVSMYQVMKGGGTLDGEFFPESLLRRSFDDDVVYSAALRDRRVDVVVLFDSYRRTNEAELLEGLARSSHPCDGPRVCVRLELEAPLYRVYDVTRS